MGGHEDVVVPLVQPCGKVPGIELIVTVVRGIPGGPRVEEFFEHGRLPIRLDGVAIQAVVPDVRVAHRVVIAEIGRTVVAGIRIPALDPGEEHAACEAGHSGSLVGDEFINVGRCLRSGSHWNAANPHFGIEVNIRVFPCFPVHAVAVGIPCSVQAAVIQVGGHVRFGIASTGYVAVPVRHNRVVAAQDNVQCALILIVILDAVPNHVLVVQAGVGRVDGFGGDEGGGDPLSDATVHKRLKRGGERIVRDQEIVNSARRHVSFWQAADAFRGRGARREARGAGIQDKS